jgi:hypothetical protein
LDEAQIWSRYGKYEYGLSGAAAAWGLPPIKEHGSLLQVAALCLAQMQWRQVFVGTQMRLADAAAVASGVGKTTEAELFMVPVSLFLSPQGVLDVLASALPLDLEKSEVRGALAPLAEQLSGRPRFVGKFITSFLQLVAISEVASALRIFSDVVRPLPSLLVASSIRDSLVSLVCLLCIRGCCCCCAFARRFLPLPCRSIRPIFAVHLCLTFQRSRTTCILCS